MADKKSAASGARPAWDKDEWAAKAKAKDEEGAEYAKSAEQALAEGKLPPKRRLGDDMPKPTKALEARKEELDLNRNLNKTMLVSTTTTGKGPRGAGFYCELCNRTFKDSLSYLDHVNGRAHLRMLGQTTQVSRSTLVQVQAKIASLRASTATAVTAKNFDFNERLKAVRQAENDERESRKEERRRKKEKKREEEELRRMGIFAEMSDTPTTTNQSENPSNGREDRHGNGRGHGRERDNKESRAKRRKLEEETQRKAREDEQVNKVIQEKEDMAAMMGFGGFGSSKR